jgi:hypothetical protein
MMMIQGVIPDDMLYDFLGYYSAANFTSNKTGIEKIDVLQKIIERIKESLEKKKEENNKLNCTILGLWYDPPPLITPFGLFGVGNGYITVVDAFLNHAVARNIHGFEVLGTVEAQKTIKHGVYFSCNPLSPCPYVASWQNIKPSKGLLLQYCFLLAWLLFQAQNPGFQDNQ